jgi:hypothetical protein
LSESPDDLSNEYINYALTRGDDPFGNRIEAQTGLPSVATDGAL